MKNFQDKLAVISGGAGGIGSAVAAQLLERGAKVILADLDLERARQVAAQFGTPKATAHRLDVASELSWLDLRATIGPCDILISSAGVAFTGSLDTIPVDAWRWVYEVNFMASFFAVRTFLPAMKARGQEAHISLLCSITALHPFAEQGAYSTAKAALLNYATVLQRELVGTQIGVSAVCPGIVDTSLRANAIEARPDALKTIQAPTPALSTKLGMQPRFVAKALVDAIAAKQFFVFTHADYAPSITAERDLMLSTMRESADPNYREPANLVEPLPR